MLYTVIPLEQIYRKDGGNTVQKNQNEQVEMSYKEVMLPHGRIVARREGDNHIVERVHSSDMKDYLNIEYHPGKILE